mgnify:CR=1 FL=1
MRTASYFIFASALLHVVGVAVSGFHADSFSLLTPAIVYALIGFWLFRQMRGLTWLSLIIMIIGVAAATASIVGISIVPTWVFWAILVANLGADLTLFVVIWSGTNRSAAKA